MSLRVGKHDGRHAGECWCHHCRYRGRVKRIVSRRCRAKSKVLWRRDVNA